MESCNQKSKLVDNFSKNIKENIYSQKQLNEINHPHSKIENFQVNQKSQRKEKKQKSKKESQELIVNLRYDDEDTPAYFKYQSAKKNQKFFYSSLDILDQNRYKFILNNKRLFQSINNKHSKVSWDEIFQVIYQPFEVQVCPFCLEKNILCPVISYCGHIFCWPCIKTFENYLRNWNKELKCPYCKDIINPNLLKFCQILKHHEYQVNENITFNLIMRDRRSPTLYNTQLDPDLEEYNNVVKDLLFLPSENEKAFSFSKYFYSNDIQQKFEIFYNNLESNLLDELKIDKSSELYDDEKIISIQKCMEDILFMKDAYLNLTEETELDLTDLNKKTSSHSFNSNDNKLTNMTSSLSDKSKKKKSSEVQNSLVYFFQEHTANIYYLNPLNYRILVTEYEGEENIPTEITGKIIEIEEIQMGPQFKLNYDGLNHLSDGTIIYLVEIDMKPLVSNISLKMYQTQLKERSKHRSSIKDEESHYESVIKKIKDEEKKKNSDKSKKIDP